MDQRTDHSSERSRNAARNDGDAARDDGSVGDPTSADGEDDQSQAFSAPGGMEAPERSVRDSQEHRAAVDHQAEQHSSRLQETGAPAKAMLSADEIFHRVSVTADHEFQRTPRMLWFSGLAAGLSIGLSFLARMTLGAATGAPATFVGDLLFPLGFIVVVLGRYQLFTENTLTPVTLVLTRVASIPALLRLWGVVYSANIVGTIAVAALLSTDGALTADLHDAGLVITDHLFQVSVRELFVRGILAGAVIASLVWLIHAVTDSVSRIVLVYLLILIIPSAGLYHCISETAEVAWGVMMGQGSVGQALAFTLTVTAGNIVGGVLLVAVINYGQTRDNSMPGRDEEEYRLSWRQVLMGWHIGRTRGSAVAPELDREAGI